MIGAEPAAWSMFSLISTNGTKKPSAAAKVIAKTNEIPTATPNIGIPCQSEAAVPEMIPTIKPRLKPIQTSLKKCLVKVERSICPNDIPRTNTVEDCVPTFPPISMIKGIKIATAATDSNVCSNSSMTTQLKVQPLK